MSPFDRIRDIRDSIQRVVFVTGAGISQESGIPTFRGKDGLWRDYDSQQLATIDAFYTNPKLVWEWYCERRENIVAATPNVGHVAIAEMSRLIDVHVITQNIDGLHQRAGSYDIVELHGNITRVRCTVCDFITDDIQITKVPPICKCTNLLRPDVVWFGEPLDQDIWNTAIARSSHCDMMIIVGTSLVVSPANMLPAVSKQNGAILVEINPDETPMSPEMDIIIRDTSASALPKLVSIFT